MKEFIEKALHQKIEINKFDKKDIFPLVLRGSYTFYTMETGGQQCLLARPRQETGLAAIRKHQKQLELLTGMYCVLYLTKMNYYSRDKMLEEGIPFIWEERQIYMPFFGILLKENETRIRKPYERISFLTQKLLLTALYGDWEDVTVTLAAERLRVSKMSITRCFDEIESLDIPVLEKKGRIRRLINAGNRKKQWELIEPFVRTPVIREYFLEEKISNGFVKSGMSALSEFSMLEDNAYPTYAVTKTQMRDYGIKNKKQVPKGEIPGCVVQELGYLIPFKDGKVVDPLTVLLLLQEDREEPRVGMALEEMLEEYVW